MLILTMGKMKSEHLDNLSEIIQLVKNEDNYNIRLFSPKSVLFLL
jgi:hypothetical protein